MTPEQKFTAKMKHYGNMMFFAKCLFLLSMTCFAGLMSCVFLGGTDSMFVFTIAGSIGSGLVGLIMADEQKSVFDEEDD